MRDDSIPKAATRWRHWLLAILGWACVGLGVIGIFLPLLPTTPFLLLALWAFARSSRRFHQWLLNHRILGRFVAEWERHHVIPVRAKVVSLTAMGLSLCWVVFFTTTPWYGVAGMALIMVYGAWFILSKPSIPPAP